MPETAPNTNTQRPGTEVMVPGYHRRLLRRYYRHHYGTAAPAASNQSEAPLLTKRGSGAEVKPAGRRSKNFLKRVIHYLNIAARFKQGEQQQAGQTLAKAAVKKIVKKL